MIFLAAPAQKADKLNSPDSLIQASLKPLVEKLPEELNESSGLILWRNLAWTINDSGNEPVIYGFDPTSGAIVRRYRVSNFPNIDWEELSHDEGFLYVGDFGNNAGNRRDLRVLRIPKAALPLDRDTSIEASAIEFSFGDQTDFQATRRATSFDCEAMFSMGDSLYLFTKDWKAGQTSVYALPTHPGKYLAKKQSTFPVNGLVTGACFDPEARLLVLLGYANYLPFLLILDEFPAREFFAGRHFRVRFSGSRFFQTEGICFGPQAELWISSESSATDPALFQFSLKEIIPKKSH